MGSTIKTRNVNSLVKSFRVKILFIQETKKTSWSMEEIRILWADDEFDFLWVESDGKSGGLLVVWDRNWFSTINVTKKSNVSFDHRQMDALKANDGAKCKLKTFRLLFFGFDGKAFGELDGWWISPRSVLVNSQARSRIVEANFKFTVAIAGSMVNDQRDYGGTLVSDKETVTMVEGPR
ncbi:hypothetical protein V6N11_032860 [Hibiscus sabdariffa]|uniref:Uncharacterized protein n=1 Tax=Hibiscus sabdariffa TaxID=183260 RepID=A0ABR2T1X7_9ROSI